MNKFIVIYLVICLIQEIVAVDECAISLKYGSPKMPLILENSPALKPIYPKDGVIHMSQTENFLLTCLGSKFKHFKDNDLNITCVGDEIVRVQNRRKNFRYIECESYPTSIVRKREGTCFGNGFLYDIGFEVGNEFRVIMGICYIQSEARTAYAYYNYTHLSGSNPDFEPFNEIPFQDDGLFKVDIEKIYTHKYQKKQFDSLNNQPLVNHSLISGQLIPTSYFVYGYEKSAAFHYLNTAPQWNVINRGNWRQVEENVRKLLIAGGDKLALMSGTYGVAVLPNVENQEEELFLYEDETNQIPVPKFVWKLIYNKEQEKGTVIIGVNNPHLQYIPKDYFFCKDICSELKWFSLKTNNISEGYVFCCEMQDFLTATKIENIFADRKSKPEVSTKKPEPKDCDDIFLGLFCD